LYKEIQDLTFCIDGAPKILSLACDHDDHLVEMPLLVGARPAVPDVACKGATELEDPAPYCLV
jgi:hypothetical protein